MREIQEIEAMLSEINPKLVTLMNVVDVEYKGIVEEAIAIFGEVETLFNANDYKKASVRTINFGSKLTDLENVSKGKEWENLLEDCLNSVNTLEKYMRDLAHIKPEALE